MAAMRLRWSLHLALLGTAAGFAAPGIVAHRSAVVLSDAKRSVSDLVGNQHGVKYAFDESRVEGAASGADYSSKKPIAVAADDAWAEPALERARAAASLDELEALFDCRGGAFAADGDAFGEAELRNDEPTWESTVGEIVGPGRESFAIVAALGSKSFSIDTPPQRVVTSLPPRRGGGRGVVLRVGRTPASAPAAWAALVVATEDVAPKVWRLE